MSPEAALDIIGWFKSQNFKEFQQFLKEFFITEK